MNIQHEHGQIIPIPYSRSKTNRAKELRKQMTSAERRLWHALKTKQLYGLHFRRQQPIAGFIADFYCHRLSLVIEIDGSIHDETADYDAERDKILSDQALTIIRFQNHQVLQNLEGVLNQITQAAYQLDTKNQAS